MRLLRDAAVDGRLSHDSFVRRVDLALRARDGPSLSDLVADLARPRRVRAGLRTALAALGAPLTAGTPTLSLPGRTESVLVLGRRAGCDVILPDPSVSRVHAVLMLFAGQWFIADQGSTNGTRVNGRRVWGAAAVRPGDRVSLGRTTFRLVPPRGTG